jgi:hypothetical protein
MLGEVLRKEKKPDEVTRASKETSVQLTEYLPT